MQEQVTKFLRRRGVIPAVVGVTSFAAGATLGYLFGRREIVEVVPAETPDEFKVVITLPPEEIFEEPGVSESVEEAAFEREQDAFRDILRKENYVEEVVIIDDGFPTYPKDRPNPKDIKVDTQALISRNVFEEADLAIVDNWNYDLEVQRRNQTEPYVLHKDEFWAEEVGYEQTTLTYYEGDNVLVDQDDNPIYNIEGTIGPLLFGHGSGDENVYHVRNDKLEAEYEVVRDTGLYATIVLGLEAEADATKSDLKHSSNRRFRSDE